ncbi:cytochrome P460 family protein [Quisquiliibacterium transsilvanicum]|uniref:Cytochrome P460 domain-containing protein n=1 Tax=Quisquiliibacterium transsilvanicum TaxID=1549638 RepID=A0A7W8M7Q8_9BURK|nr:cytochrome P460 family protein [Quisquiliibacterium transsilvanicum]MBB5270460.1 hypothetical protein [Quisquiliibacterium transsilvanicum]
MKNSLAAVAAVAAVAVLACAAPARSADAPQVPYPDAYRDWRHVKTMVIQAGHPLHESFGGIHHVYANRKALDGYRTGKFPDGSVIVLDLLEAPAADSGITEGARKLAGVMHKDARKYATTGGWGYEAFGAGDRNKRMVGANAATACHACHVAQKDHGYVFSTTRD